MPRFTSQRAPGLMTTRPMTANRNSAGFTLIELMIVVAIIGVLLMVGAVAIGGQRDAGKVRKATADFQLTYQQARAFAMENNVAVRFEVQAGMAGVDMFAADPVVEAYDLATDQCNSAIVDATTPIVERTFGADGGYTNVTITRVAPSAGTQLVFCIRPNGRVYDIATRAPFTALTDQFGGRTYIEFNAIDCESGTCAEASLRRTMMIEFNGMMDIMPVQFRLGS